MVVSSSIPPVTCPICGSPTISKIGKVALNHYAYSEGSQLRRCSSCFIAWIDPLPDEAELSAMYANTYHYDPNTVKDALISFKNSLGLMSDKLLITRFKKRGTILDIGAGRGDLLRRFPAKRWERWIYDPHISSDAIELAQHKIGFHVNDHTRLEDYPPNSFDVVVLRNVVEHTARFRELIRYASILLREEGFLFIRTPNLDSLDFKVFGTNWYVIGMPGHIVFFNLLSLQRVVEALGMKVRFSKPVLGSGLLALFRSSRSRLPAFLLFPLSIFYSIISIALRQGGDVRTIAQKERGVDWRSDLGLVRHHSK